MKHYRYLILRTGEHEGKYTPFHQLSYRVMLKIIPGIMLFGVASVYAQVSSIEINYFSRCRQIEDVRSRAACYDDLYDRAVRVVNPQADAARLQEENRRMREELARIRGRTASTPVRTESDIDNFGRTEPRVVNRDDGKEELFDRIASLQQIPDGWIVTLESGQVWRQVNSKRYNLRKGQEVKITPSIFGSSYHLSVEELGGFIQVTRIQ